LLALLGACGTPEEKLSELSDTDATRYAAQAMHIAPISLSALGTLLTSTETLVAGGSGGTTTTTAATPDVQIQSAATAEPQAAALATPTPRPCPAGGSVTAVLSGGNPVGQQNGRFNQGETYDLTYTGCQPVSGLTLNGKATLLIHSVDLATGALDVTWTLNMLRLTRSTLAVQFTAGKIRQVRSIDSSQRTRLDYSEGQWITVLTIGTKLRPFTVSAVQASTLADSSSLSVSGGLHTLSDGVISFDISQDGLNRHNLDGLPQQGNWILSRPNGRMRVQLDPAGVNWLRIDFDDDADGSIERSLASSPGSSTLQNAIFN
jgi:hypothetical protein